MATETTPTPTETVKPSVILNKSIAVWQSAVEKAEIAFDNVRNTAKSEMVKHGWTEKQLTSLLLDAGLDPARASEVKGFVFPAHSAARKELDKAMAHNAKQDDAKKRVAKQVILALQRDKTGSLTLEAALAQHKKDRQPGGQTSQVEKAKKKTAKEIEAELNDMIAAALQFAKENGYDFADFSAMVEDKQSVIFETEEEEEEEEEDAE